MKTMLDVVGAVKDYVDTHAGGGGGEKVKNVKRKNIRGWKKISNGWNVYGKEIWIDGDNIYHSQNRNHLVFDKSTSTWSTKSWNGINSIDFNGQFIWTDGDNIYYSYGSTHYVLDRSTSTWVTKAWSGLTSFYGNQIWTDGSSIYYSTGSNSHYVLDKSTSTWSTESWNVNIAGAYMWFDGINLHCLDGTTDYTLRNSWESSSSSSSFPRIYGDDVWTDGTYIYVTSNSEKMYMYDTSTNQWNTTKPIRISGLSGASSGFDGSNIWSDGDNIYYSGGNDQQYILSGFDPHLKTFYG